MTEARKLRREFNRWFYSQYADADGEFSGVPDWFKADQWEAFKAGRALLETEEKPQ